MTLLTYAQDVCNEVGIEPPGTIINNEDDDAKRLLTLFNTEGKRLSRRYEWQALTKEKTLTTVSGDDQGVISSIADDVDRIIPDTAWNRSERRFVRGSQSGQAWQQDKAFLSTRLVYYFRLRGNHLLMNPSPAAGETVAFEYISNKFVLAADGTTGKTAFTMDNDNSVLDEDILKLGVKWRLRKAIGAEYQSDFQEYQEQLRLLFGNDTPRGVINMDANSTDAGVAVVSINK